MADQILIIDLLQHQGIMWLIEIQPTLFSHLRDWDVLDDGEPRLTSAPGAGEERSKMEEAELAEWKAPLICNLSAQCVQRNTN